jgi:large subunit ribosomal protein L25
MKIEIAATKRSAQGTGASRRLRRASRVPGILYGGKTVAQPIELDHNEIFHKLRQEAFHASILTVVLDGVAEQALLRDVQMHAWKPEVLHIDFQRVAADQKIHMKVPLHFVNADIAPGVKTSGGNVSHIMNEIEVACLPHLLPEFIEVDLANLQSGHSLHVSDLKVAAGIDFVVTHKGDNPPVATIVLPRAAKTADEEPAAAVAPVAAPKPAAAAAAKPAAAPAKKK